MKYREPLPSGCPPSTARQIEEPITRYRLLNGAEPSHKDFDSYVKIKGGPILHIGRSHCHQAGISLHTTYEAALRVLNGHFNKTGRWEKIGELTIHPGDGKLETPEPNGHQTWWPTRQFDAAATCKALP